MIGLYRIFSTQVVKPLLEGKVFKYPEKHGEIFRVSVPTKKSNRVWFHAASVGELEMLTPLIEKWSGEKMVTLFSESAARNLESLQKMDRMIFAGYSPWEGEWGKALEIFKPDLFVSARYEAWPELWASLGAMKIPLAIVGAKLRRSLRAAQFLVKMMGGVLPQFHFFTTEEKEGTQLKKAFPSSSVFLAGDPRWERVMERASKGNARAGELVKICTGLPRPWGVLGSVWEEDLKHLGRGIFKFPGTLWLVPHQVDLAQIEKFESWITEESCSWVKTSGLQGTLATNPKVILVDEMGFLSELYGSADWAYIGGGFGKSIHNTIEPAVHGIPVCSGPEGVEKFPETSVLQASKQLRVVRNGTEFEEWYVELTKKRDPRSRELWKAQAEKQLGATARILTWFRDVLALRT